MVGVTTNEALLKNRTNRQQIDAVARSVAARSIAGAMPEADARWTLAALVYRSDIPENVVGRAVSGRSIPRQACADSVESVREQLTKMIVGPNPKLDLNLVADGSSLCGWASRIISGPFVFPKTNFDTRNRCMREVTVNDDTISSLIALRSMSDLGISSIPSHEEERGHNVVDEYFLLAKGLREWELVHLNAEHICAVSAVAPPRRAIHLRNRQTLLKRLELSVDTCRSDLAEFVEREDVASDSLAVLFSNLSIDDVDRIARLNPLSSQMLARSALTPVPQPRQSVVRSLRTSIETSVGGPRAASQLCRAYVNVVSEVEGSEFAPCKAPRRIKKRSERKADFANWDIAVEGLVERGHLDLGQTPDMVLTTMSQKARAISVERASCAQLRKTA